MQLRRPRSSARSSDLLRLLPLGLVGLALALPGPARAWGDSGTPASASRAAVMHVDSSGRQFDSQGRFIGRVDASGRRYDSQGRYLGRTDTASGRLYDSQGRYLGHTDPGGRVYDPQGRYQGRVDADGRQYDAQGRYTGRLTDRAGPARPDGAPSAAAGGNARQLGDSQRIAPSVFCSHGQPGCGR